MLSNDTSVCRTDATVTVVDWVLSSSCHMFLLSVDLPTLTTTSSYRTVSTCHTDHHPGLRPNKNLSC